MRMKRGTAEDGEAVAEMQGLYGPFSFPERLLQKMWARRDYDGVALHTAAGAAVRVIEPGQWNLLGGPDFRRARIEIDGRVVTGDVELHLSASDWDAHGHARDPAYAGVVLHVVLFPPKEAVTAGFGGGAIPVLALLPHLLHGLEEYAGEDAVEALAGRPLHAAETALAALAPAERRETLAACGRERWRFKVRIAGQRVVRLGWSEACHQTALEILGYRFNRVPMLQVAARRPLERWRGVEEAEAIVEACLGDDELRWSFQGVRPANHPRRRLAQYARWVAAVPDWPERLVCVGEAVGPGPEADSQATGKVRKAAGFAAWRREKLETLVGGAVSGSRLDTLWCDGMLPLLASRADEERAAVLERVWWHWFAGDQPEAHGPILRRLGIFSGADWPACHGAFQGLLGWMLRPEAGAAKG